MNKVTTTHIWAPGGRTRAIPEWEWAWSFVYQDRNGRYHDVSCTHLYKDRAECDRDMHEAIAAVEGGGLTSTARCGIMRETPRFEED